MAEENKKSYQIKLDFRKIAKWRDSERDDLPVCGMVGFYKACGLVDLLLEHPDEFSNQSAAMDFIACNLKTHQRIRDFILEQWKVYSLMFKNNYEIVWDTHTYPKGKKRYPRNLTNGVLRSVATDFLNYCPKLDDEIPDNVIEIKVPEVTEESKIIDAQFSEISEN